MKKTIITLGLFSFMSLSTSAQRLIVRMDDIGASHSENLAVIHCYQNGIGRSAEVMSVCPWFMEAAAMLNENPGLDVGVHVAFRSEWVGYRWRPLTNCKSICDEDGYLLQTNFRDFDIREVETELRAQIELAMKYCKNVTHVTDHCMWTMNQDLYALVQRVAAEYGLWYQGQVKTDEEMGILTLDMPFGGAGSRKDKMLEGLKKMEKGKTYWTIEHPAFDNEEMKGIYEIGRNGQRTDTGKDRQDVTNTFTDPDIMRYIKDNGIELVSFGDVLRERRK